MYLLVRIENTRGSKMFPEDENFKRGASKDGLERKKKIERERERIIERNNQRKGESEKK